MMRNPVLMAVVFLIPATSTHAADQEPATGDPRLKAAHTSDDRVLITSTVQGDFPVPDINDFRLERIGEDGKLEFVPLLFGDDRSMLWPESARVDQFELWLNPIRARHPELMEAEKQLSRSIAVFYADALLHPGADYRLTWKRRPDNSASVVSVRFRWQPDGEQEVRADLPKRFYLCEVLFRHENTLFLGQTVMPRLLTYGPRFTAVGFDANGKPLDAPSPGSDRMVKLREEYAIAEGNHPVPAPALAMPTTYYHVRASDHWSIAVSDLGGAALLPTKPGEPTFELWHGINPYYPMEAAIFRCEVLTGNVQKLRKDVEHWKTRTESIRQEVLAREPWIRESPDRRLPIATFVLRDKGMLAETRNELIAWLKEDRDQNPAHQTTEQADIRRRIRSHMNVIVMLGDKRDLPLLSHLAGRDFTGSNLVYMAGIIARQFGVVAAADVLCILLRNQRPESDSSRLKLLRKYETDLPPRLQADQVLVDLCRHLKIRPSEFGYIQAEESLLKLASQIPLSEYDRKRFPIRIENGTGQWYAPSSKVRRRAITELSKRLRKQP